MLNSEEQSETSEKPPVDGAADTEPNGSVADSKPTKKLPYAKCSAKNQFKILQVMGMLSTQEQKAVSVKQVAEVMDTHPNTVSACNPFLSDVGLVTKNGHKFVPAKEVINYSDRLQWNAEDAGNKLAPIMIDTWFAQTLKPRLQFKSHTEDEAIAVLADASSSAPKYKAQLANLLEYLELAGLVKKENGNVLWISESSIDQNQSNNASGRNSDETKKKSSQNTVVDPGQYRTVEVPMIDGLPAKILLPHNMGEDEWETYEAVYEIYIKKFKKKDLGTKASKTDADLTEY